MPSGRQYIDVSGYSFASSRYGLLSVADVSTPGDTRWQNGVEFQPIACDTALVTRNSCLTDITTKVPTVTGSPAFGADPFTVYSWVGCSLVGTPRAEYERRTTEALARGEGRGVEDVFWTGNANGESVLPHLAENTTTVEDGVVLQTAASPVTTGSAVDVVTAVGLLEGELAQCYGGEGVLHVPATAVAHLADRGQLIQDGDMLRTWYGNRVAVYASNNRQGPTGVNPAAGQYWFYATGPVTVLRSNVFLTPFAESIDRSKNNVVQIAERTYIIKWDCCHLAAQVALPS